MGHFNTFNTDKVFSYSLMSNQILSMLYDVEKNMSSSYLHPVLISKATTMIDTMKNGDLLQHMETVNLNSLSSIDNLFMYDYGKSALQTLHTVSQDESVQSLFEKLKSYIQEIENEDLSHVKELKNFFKVVSDLLSNDLENNYYQQISLPMDTPDMLGWSYL